MQFYSKTATGFSKIKVLSANRHENLGITGVSVHDRSVWMCKMRVMECLHDYISLWFASSDCHPCAHCVGMCVSQRRGGGCNVSSMLMSSQHAPIKLHNPLSFFPLACLSVNLACWPSFTPHLSLQVNSSTIPQSDASDRLLPQFEFLMTSAPRLVCRITISWTFVYVPQSAYSCLTHTVLPTVYT